MRKIKNIESVVRYAKSIMKECRSRNELVLKVAEHFNLSPNTVQFYFALLNFRTGFRPYPIITGRTLTDNTVEVLKKIITEKPITEIELSKVYQGKRNNLKKAIRYLIEKGFPIRKKSVNGVEIYWI